MHVHSSSAPAADPATPANLSQGLHPGASNRTRTLHRSPQHVHTPERPLGVTPGGREEPEHGPDPNTYSLLLGPSVG